MSNQRNRIVLPYKGGVMAFNLTEDEMEAVLDIQEKEPEKYKGAEGVMKALEVFRARHNSE